MSSFVPSTWRNASSKESTAASSGSPSSSSPEPTKEATALPAGLYTDCQACRVTGTLTFSAVGLYALTVARSQAKTNVGKSVASAAGLGFLAVAAARWSTYAPPPLGEERIVVPESAPR
ncbi:hypothetical protein JCM10908_005514 [Rhodotorula pacifica]|uniref:uncharacterized protein n=1 Tax=Rhodotorula pacifica TaxID=1495444 RepID=UPI0031811128